MKDWWLVALVVASLVVAGCAGAYENPPDTLTAADLVGTWGAEYAGGGVDQLVLRADGTFQQTYQRQNGYTFETGWNPWWLEPLPDGRIHVHLQGARYYLQGVEDAEEEGLLQLPAALDSEPPRPALPNIYHDPYGPGNVEMVGKLVLTVRVTLAGELILHHLWDYSDRGFAIFDGEWEVFRRIRH